jgi:hypothetical protein
MSMMARFVAISPDHLATVRQRPDMIATVFALDENQSSDSLAHAQERLRFQAPRLLSEMLERMPPDTRQRMQRRLQLKEDGRPGAGANKTLLLQLAARELARQNRQAARMPPAPRHCISLDKAWHGLHYLLCGMVGPTSDPLGQAVCGGEGIGRDKGYGPARCFPATQVVEIARALQARGLEAILARRFDTADMTQMGVYPGAWEEDDRGWLIEAFRDLRAFYAEASGASHAVVTVIE